MGSFRPVAGSSTLKRDARLFRSSTAPRESRPASISGESTLSGAAPRTSATASATWSLQQKYYRFGLASASVKGVTICQAMSQQQHLPVQPDDFYMPLKRKTFGQHHTYSCFWHPYAAIAKVTTCILHSYKHSLP